MQASIQNISKEEKIREIERIKLLLEHHFQKYRDDKHDSEHKSRKKDRDKASKSMILHADYIKQKLHNSIIFNIINDGAQFQFESFGQWVESDLPDYMKKIESFLEKLKSEKDDEIHYKD